MSEQITFMSIWGVMEASPFCSKELEQEWIKREQALYWSAAHIWYQGRIRLGKSILEHPDFLAALLQMTLTLLKEQESK